MSVQLYFADLFSSEEFHLEKPFPSIQRIADCVWESKKLIFEIQCSSISKQEVKKRMQDYASCGYTVIWIFHDSHFSFKRLSPAQHYLKKFTHYYTNINLEGKGILYDYFDQKKMPVDMKKLIIPFWKSPWKIHFEGDRLNSKLKLSQNISSPKKPFFLRRFLQVLSAALIK